VTSGYTPTESTILKQLREDLYKIWDEIGEGVPLVISMNTQVTRIMGDSTELQKQLGVSDFKRGEINLKVKSLDDVPILRVPSARMHTKYEFLDGESASQKVGGFRAAADAKAINWEIMGVNTPMAISKTDITRIFDPLTNQKAHAWKLDYRKYHDLWMLANKLKSVWVNTR
jgi:hypothetical protein